MNASLMRRFVILAAVVFSLAPYRSYGQVLQNLGPSPWNGNDNAQGFFASQGDAFHSADPAGLPAWGSAGSGPYAGYTVPSVPPPPATPLYGSQLLPAERYYGSPYAFNFTDSGSPATTATAIIAAGPTGGTSVASAGVLTNFTLNEPLASPQYAYEQVDFATDFGVAGPLTGGLGGAPAMAVSGSTTGTGSYAQFAGVLNYWWTGSNTAFSGSSSGVWTNLGALNYSWSTSGPGTFGATVTPTGSLSAALSGPGILEVTGDFFVAGDPAQFSVATVPEPCSLGLLTVAALAVLPRRKSGRIAHRA